jgi:hypothetical protein
MQSAYGDLAMVQRSLLRLSDVDCWLSRTIMASPRPFSQHCDTITLHHARNNITITKLFRLGIQWYKNALYPDGNIIPLRVLKKKGDAEEDWTGTIHTGIHTCILCKF